MRGQKLIKSHIFFFLTFFLNPTHFHFSHIYFFLFPSSHSAPIFFFLFFFSSPHNKPTEKTYRLKTPDCRTRNSCLPLHLSHKNPLSTPSPNMGVCIYINFTHGSYPYTNGCTSLMCNYLHPNKHVSLTSISPNRLKKYLHSNSRILYQ